MAKKHQDDTEKEAVDRRAASSADRIEDMAGAALEAMIADRQRVVMSGMLDAAEAIDAARDSLSKAKRDEAAQAAAHAAQWLQDYANDMARGGPTRTIESIEEAARRNPALFIGGAAALGAAVMWRLQSRGPAASDGTPDAPAPDADKASGSKAA